MGPNIGIRRRIGFDGFVRLAENDAANAAGKNRVRCPDRFGRDIRCFARNQSGNAGAYEVD
jgi:hypothetical protein